MLSHPSATTMSVRPLANNFVGSPPAPNRAGDYAKVEPLLIRVEKPQPCNSW
jgi:hypothetical protein